MNKTIIFAILLIGILLFIIPVAVSQGNKEEDKCSGLGFSLECFIQKTIGGATEKLKDPFRTLFDFIFDPKINSKGNEKLWQFSYGFSFSLAAILLIFVIVSYFKEVAKEDSNVEIIDAIKNQLLKLVLMFIFLLASPLLSSLALEFFDILNSHLLHILNFNITESIIQLLISSLFALFPLAVLSAGVAIIFYIMIFVTFMVVASIRVVILYILLSIIPIATVLYFFEPTKRIGDIILKLTISHIIIFTVWMIIFAVAFDIGKTNIGDTEISTPLISGFLLLAALMINSALYYKINSFFANLVTEAQTGARGVVSTVFTKERVHIIREKMLGGKSIEKEQTRLAEYR